MDIKDFDKMPWIDEFDLFLFDFDGLLVNTEEIHYQAYFRMCEKRGIHFDWSFPYYCSIAHYRSDGLREQIYAQFPALYAQEPSWDILYAEKKKAFLELLQEGIISLMPGANELLTHLHHRGTKRAVVTHSPNELVANIRKLHPILNTIPNWITREHYSRPKPDPECYINAINKLASPSEKIVGFEDTPRGLEALMGTRAQPIIVSTIDYPEIPLFLTKGALRYRSLKDIIQKERI